MSNNTGPSEIFTIRHGEKVNDPNKDEDGGRHLSVMRSARAAALPSLFAQAQSALGCELYRDELAFRGDYHTIPTKAKAGRFSSPNVIFVTEDSMKLARAPSLKVKRYWLIRAQEL